ncbi:TIM barrel protein [Tepidibacter sp. Z1-5]|uniref:TIM barrel protein n=1 Tax=Tepidibacter sp. Z1-5 TaxID=3134138 RepID=UPI0030C2DA24
MIKIGRNIRDNYKYKDEVEFSRKNKFDLIQVWYDKNGLEVNYEGNSKLEFIESCDFPIMIHAMLDINEFDEHAHKLVETANLLNNKDLIIHPICENEIIDSNTAVKLSKEIKKVLKLCKENGITLHLENNSKRMPIFSNTQDIKTILEKNPDLEILIDLAHVEDCSQIEDIVKIRRPKILHIADRRFSVTHEHLPIGDGELDYEYIFKEILYDFDGTIILEIVQNDQSIIDSKNRIVSLLEGRKINVI